MTMDMLPLPGDDSEIDAHTGDTLPIYLANPEMRERYRQRREQATGETLTDEQVVASLEWLRGYRQRQGIDP